MVTWVDLTLCVYFRETFDISKIFMLKDFGQIMLLLFSKQTLELEIWK